MAIQQAEGQWPVGRRRLRLRPLLIVVGLTVCAQMVLAVAVALGGSPLVGAVATGFVTVCSLLLIGAATVQSYASTSDR